MLNKKTEYREEIKKILYEMKRIKKYKIHNYYNNKNYKNIEIIEDVIFLPLCLKKRFSQKTKIDEKEKVKVDLFDLEEFEKPEPGWKKGKIKQITKKTNVAGKIYFVLQILEKEITKTYIVTDESFFKFIINKKKGDYICYFQNDNFIDIKIKI